MFSRTATSFRLWTTSLLKVSPGKCLLLLIHLTLQPAHRSQLVQKALLYLALLLACASVTYLYVFLYAFLHQSTATPTWQVVAVALSILILLFILGIFNLIVRVKIYQLKTMTKTP